MSYNIFNYILYKADYFCIYKPRLYVYIVMYIYSLYYNCLCPEWCKFLQCSAVWIWSRN